MSNDLVKALEPTLLADMAMVAAKDMDGIGCERGSYMHEQMMKVVESVLRQLSTPEAHQAGAGRGRCEICDWPLADSRENGCVPGDCSYRPEQGSEEYRRIQERRRKLASEAPSETIRKLRAEATALANAQAKQLDGRIPESERAILRAVEHVRWLLSEAADALEAHALRSPDAAGVREACAKVAAEAAELYEKLYAESEKQDAKDRNAARHYCAKEIAAAIRALPLPVGPVTPGWKVVPVEPTPEMYSAYKRAISNHIENLPQDRREAAKGRPHGWRVKAKTKFRERWKAMLAAAPAAPVSGPTEEEIAWAIEEHVYSHPYENADGHNSFVDEESIQDAARAVLRLLSRQEEGR